MYSARVSLSSMDSPPARPGCDREKIEQGIPSAFLPSIAILEEPCLSISSTDIRARVKAGQSIEGMVPDAVQQYIYHHSLYID
jgi:nicotinate-nucleotide adenylyltransferase